MSYAEPTVETGGAEAPSPSTETGGTAPAPAFDPTPYASHQVTVKVDGQDVTVPLNEALSGYQRQADYTRKTQALAERQSDLDFLDSLDTAFANNPQATVAYLADQYGVDLASLIAPGNANTSDDADLDEVDPRFSDLEARVNSVSEFQSQQMVEREFADLKAEFGDRFDVNELEILQHAVKHNSPNLRAAFADMMFGQAVEKLSTYETAEQQAAAERDAGNQNARTAARAAGIVEGGHSVQGGAPAGISAKPSLREALLAAAKDHGVTLNV
jgi:hypothetical protein